ncbi:EF-hand domain and EF-hand domain pair-containing protein [Strongyloides ratti]|uniref:EF-hand domain and EF-hand domain pair-containing protein n=1 Tax=Strongyloides ratti TaxID=34506 RepID=A0A090L8M2_STRRB|nr:EF-hand domain and EF-hand domain pair-containing protein [Strongyloides ratti]CEF63835.1 EF-hand domain and EF-hand domain pair-containing protein [Strongyloides ratti]
MWKKVLVSFLAISTVTGFNLDDFDDNKDGKIQYHEFLKLSESENGQQIKANVNKYFNNYDINKDGTLSVDELVYLTSSLPQKHENHIQKFFNMLDTNQDGFITMDEAKNSKEQIASEIINGLFQFADINNDKMISLREFSAVMEPTEIPTNNDFLKIQQARRLMALIDQNSDRKLTVEEVHKYANQNGEVKINEIEDVFSKLDTNKDGWLVINELKNIENHISIINKRINRV